MNTWLYLSNPFAVVTRTSYKLMDILLRDHAARVAKCLSKAPADQDFQVMHDRADEALRDWADVYIPYRAARGVYKARTRTFYDLLASGKVRLDDWQLDIQAAGGPERPFLAGKPPWLELFPRGREPFTTGAVDQRVAAWNVLVKSMLPHAALATVRESVEAFAAELDAARQDQQGEEGGTEMDSEAMETQRLAAAEAMYKNLGRAMEKYGSKNALVAKLFDLSYIRDGASPPPDGAPGAPLNFHLARGSGSSTVTATWSPVDGADGYRLYRRLPGEATATQTGGDIPAGPASFSIHLPDQPAGVELEYTIAAYNAAGEGPRSAPESIAL